MLYNYPVRSHTVLLLLSLLFITFPARSAFAANAVRVAPSLRGALSIRWNAVEGASHYVIEQAAAPDGTFTKLTTVNAPLTTYRHAGLGYNQTVYYRIQYYNSGALLGTSEIVSGTTHPENYVYRIMPLGDSNTFGTKIGDDDNNGNPITPYSERVAYRGELYKLLETAAIPFDFVGSQHSGSTYVADDDNAGFSGARDEDIASLLEQGSYTSTGGKLIIGSSGPYLDAYQPDIVLLHVGTNWVDGSENNMNDVNRILDQVDAYEEKTGREVTVILAKILQRVCYTENGADYCPTPDETQDTFKYNHSLQALAENRIASGDRLKLVDMEKGAGVIYKYPEHGGEMADFLHPTASGYQKMARVWFDGLVEELQVAPLPVELISFKAQVAQDNVLLKWETASEKDNSRFVVERMQEGGRFTEVGSVPGAGDSQVKLKYTYTDNSAPTGTLYYRLRQVDVDGKYEYSNVVALTRKTRSDVKKVYPNPGDGRSISLQVSGFVANELLTVQVVDGMGRNVYTASLSADALGTVNTSINFSTPLPKGFYIMQVVAPGKTEKLKLVVE
ncbi:SGNH/GDSL hydrolase family protein [Pontibacter ruber]|uniref:SGNH/GDSL hydrolase family protein n=1 Tax=Pontibacter ruber TaxID=1343895 RepID=A0ABW5CSU8_9BACT|nr:SGNH/GDSL hydrolase family protein [Pontibacter ruber]